MFEDLKVVIWFGLWWLKGIDLVLDFRLLMGFWIIFALIKI